jgi:molecular chaperone GrpE (heat shock protein)
MTEDSDQNNIPAADDQITLGQLQTDLDSAMAGWKRAAADFENFKRRKEGEISELSEFVREVTVVKLLPTIDSLEQALKHLPEYTTPAANAATPPQQGGEAPQLSQDDTRSSPPIIGGVLSDLSAEALAKVEAGGGGNDFAKKYQNWQKGVNGIVIQLDKVLSEMGVKKIESLGKKFDPNFHEAVREVESEADDGIIIDELQTGFELNGKVIRPSQVVISKKSQV